MGNTQESSADIVAKLREALMEIRKATMKDSGNGPATELHTTIDAITQDALAKPPRNCDVGTAEKQFDRWQAFCDKYDINCTGCPCDDRRHGTLAYCFAKWAQMPYEEGGAK